MHHRFRSRGNERTLCALLAAVALVVGCHPSEKGGYDKDTHRVAQYIPEPSRPLPPPVTAGAGGADAGPVVLPAGAPAGVTQAMADEGQEIYGTVCVACHGANGTGSPVAPPLNDGQWLNITGEYPEIVTVITNGVQNPVEYPAPMPPEGGGNFTDEEVRALAAYVYALSHQGGEV